MIVKDRTQVENIATMLFLLLVVSTGVFLALVLYSSPSL